MNRRPTTHQIALSGNRTLSARVWPGEGSPVVFLHGIFASSAAWSDVASNLSQPCIAFDLPGFGDSDLPTSPDISAYTDDIAAGIAALGLDRFELVGHSFGGAVAAAVADRLATRVTSLTLLAPAGFGRIALTEALTMPGIRSLAEASVRRRLSRRQIAVAPAQIAAARQANLALVAAGRSSHAAGYHGPVAAIWGSDDRVVRPRHSRDVQAAFPQADVVFWGGMGHHPLRERRDAVLELVRSGRTPRTANPSAPRRRGLIFWPFPRVRLTPRFA